VSRSAELLVYCKSSECEAAEYVILRLKELGYTNVRLFKGGIRAWIAAGKPVEKG
jgi:rhodanese-related sulfurtransferase